MRKSAYLAAAAAIVALAASCDDRNLDTPSADCPIALSVSGTRAEINMPSGTFTVAAKRCSGSTWNAGTAVNVFRATSGLQNVTTDGTGACTYTPVEYWKPNTTYRFRAVSPMAPDLVHYTDGLDGNATITNFTVSASAASQNDLLLSDLSTATTSSPIGDPAPVALTFRHLLCKVRVQIIEDANEPDYNPGSDEFTVTKVTLSGLPDRGTYTGTSTGGSWNTDAALSLSCISNSEHVAPTAFTDPTADIWSDGLKLIPMTVTNQVNLVLDYKFTHLGNTSNKTVTIPIPAITWEAGKQYTYQLSLSEDPYIYFGKISVDSWGTTQASGTVIIK